MQQPPPNTREGRWELELYERLVEHCRGRVAQGRERFGLPDGYQGEEALLLSAPHWAGQGVRKSEFDSAMDVLGKERLVFGLYAFLVHSAVRRRETGVWTARMCACSVLGAQDWPDMGLHEEVVALVRELALAQGTRRRRRWVAGMLQEATGAGIRCVLGACMAAERAAVDTREWRGLAAYCAGA